MNLIQKYKKLLLKGYSASLLVLLGTAQLLAQSLTFERRIDPFPIFDQSGMAYESALTGGYNKPVLQFVDIEGDGDPDLFLQDQDQPNQLVFFQNGGNPASWQFEWITDRYQDLQIGAWFKFADADQDGDIDLFAENPFGIIRYYRNNGSATSPFFVNLLDTVRDHLNQPIELEGFSIPEWVDIDCDTDPDLFIGRLNGRITLYANTGLGVNDIPIYEFVTDTFQGINIQTGGGKAAATSLLNRHGANSMSFVDINNDGDNDLFWGDFFATSLIHLENYGSCQNPLFIQDSIQEQYPPVNPISTGGFNVPRFSDIDADGDFDMFVGVLGGAVSFTADIIENFYFYRNTGTAAQPDFILENKQFIRTIDIGQNTIPALVDIDDDGDTDLFLANQEDLDSPDDSNSRLYFFENQGTPQQPVFRLIDDDYLNYDKRFDVNYVPAFADLDGDGDPDLLLGKFDGRLTFWRNDGSPSSPSFIMVDEFYSGIDVGSNSAPALVDIDADSDLDLFLGEFNGNINFYRNEGNGSAPTFVLDTSNYFSINPGSSEFSIPWFIDIDLDNDYDLFIGTATQGIFFYRNIGSNQTADFVADTSFQIPRQLRTSPRFTDIDADGDYDLFSGSIGGGLLFYENQEIVFIDHPDVLSGNIPDGFLLFSNYPNPFNPETTISYRLSKTGPVVLRIYNVLGQGVRTLIDDIQPAGQYKIIWDARDNQGNTVSSGIYIYRLSAGNQVQSRKMMLLR